MSDYEDRKARLRAAPGDVSDYEARRARLRPAPPPPREPPRDATPIDPPLPNMGGYEAPAVRYDLSSVGAVNAPAPQATPGGPSEGYDPDRRQGYKPGAAKVVGDRIYPAEDADVVVEAQRLYDEAKAGGGTLARLLRRPETPEDAAAAHALQDRVERDLIARNPNLIRAAGIVSTAVSGATAGLLDPATLAGDFDTARAVNRARAEASGGGRLLEALSGAVGASGPLGRFRGPVKQAVAATAYGAVSNPENPIGGALAMGANVAGGMAGRAALGPKALPADAGRLARAAHRVKGAHAEGVGSMGAAMLTDPNNPDAAVHGYGLGFGLGLQRPGARGPVGTLADRIRALKAAREKGVVAPELAGDIKREAVQTGKASVEAVASPERVEVAERAIAAGATPEEARVAVETMEPVTRPDGNRAEGLRPQAEVAADESLPAAQREAVAEATRQGVVTVSSHVDPATGKGVAVGAQAETGEARRVEVATPPDPSRLHVRLDSGDVLTQVGPAGPMTVQVERTRPDGTSARESIRAEEWRALTGATEAPAVPDRPPETLSQFVRRKGGLRYGNDEGMRGELDRLSNKETGTTGLVRKNGGGKSIEEMLQEAREEGLLPKGAEMRDFLEALEMDAVGRRSPTAEDPEAAYYRQMEERYEEYLEDRRFAQEPRSLGERMEATRFADRDVDPARLAAGVDVVRGRKKSRPLPPEAGAFDPLALVRGAGELVGVPRKAVGFALGKANEGVAALMRGVARLPGVRQGVGAAKVAAEVVREKLAPHLRGREYVTRLDERRGEIALARSDAQEAVRDLSRKADRKPLTTEEQETGTEYMTGETDRATAVERLGEEYVARLDRHRADIDKNQRAMKDLGWMSEETLAEWEGKWLPRVYTRVEAAKREAGTTSGPSVSGSKKIPGLFMRRDRPVVRWRQDGRWQNRRFETMEEAEAFVEEQRTGEKGRAAAPRGVTQYVTRDGDVVFRWREGVGENMRVHEKRFPYPRSREAESRQDHAIPAFRKELAARGLLRERPGVSDLSIIEPIPKEWREAAGEVRDPAVLIARAKASQAGVIANMRFLSKVAARWGADTRKSEAYAEEPVPADPKKYGPLAGKHLPRPLREDVVGMFREKSPIWDTIAEIADTALAEWKFGKTVLNPGTHVRNVIGNTVFGEFADFSRLDPSNFRHTARAIEIMRAKPGDPLHEVKRFLIGERIAGGDFFSTEVLELVQAVERHRGNTFGEKVKAYLADKGALAKKGRVMEAIPGAEIAQRLYQLEDVLPKMGAWVKYVADGMTPEAAAAKVRKWFPNYGTSVTSALSTTRGVKGAVARQVGPAFHSFMAESARIIGTAIKEKPAHVAALYLGIRAIASAMQSAAGVSDEDEERLTAASPRWQRPGPFRLILPNRGPDGEVRILDLNWTLPMGNEVETVVRLLSGEDDEAEIGGGGMEMSPVGPFLTMAGEQLFNRSLLTGKPIDRSTGEGGFVATSEAQGRRDRLRRLGEGLAPSLTPGIGLGWRKMREALDQTPVDLEGKVARNKGQTLADVIAGIKIREVKPADQYDKAERSIGDQVGKKLYRIYALDREPEGYKGRSKPDRERERAELAEEILALYNRRQVIRGAPKVQRVEDLPGKLRKVLVERKVPEKREASKAWPWG